MAKRPNLSKTQRALRKRLIAEGKCVYCQEKLEPDCKTRECKECAVKRKERQRRAREKARAEGRCMSCRSQPAVPGRACCERCLARQREQARARKARITNPPDRRWRARSLVPKACADCGQSRILDPEGRCDICSYNHRLRLQWTEMGKQFKGGNTWTGTDFEKSTG